MEADVHDAVVIGGGFYGSAIAVYLAQRRGLDDIVLVEREPALLTRASYKNQARVHNGYHYPRNFTTGYRSRINMPRFVAEWPDAVRSDFTKLYAIARQNSKVTSRQFARFCTAIGASIETAPDEVTSLFEPRLVESVFLVEEVAFDAERLATWATDELRASGVDVRLGTRVEAISRHPTGLVLTTRTEGPVAEATTTASLRARLVFNCTYSGLNQFGGDFAGSRTRLKHEITEMPLITVPPPLDRLGVTIMDGPFFSVMPFPSEGLHTLSHVRHTPHLSWDDEPSSDPYARLEGYERHTRVERMIRDAARFMPALHAAAHVKSLFEIKTVLAKNEGDDGRPILFEKHAELPGCYSVLGGKIDNIYDIFEKLDAEQFPPPAGARLSSSPTREATTWTP